MSQSCNHLQNIVGKPINCGGKCKFWLFLSQISFHFDLCYCVTNWILSWFTHFLRKILICQIWNVQLFWQIPCLSGCYVAMLYGNCRSAAGNSCVVTQTTGCHPGQLVKARILGLNQVDWSDNSPESGENCPRLGLGPIVLSNSSVWPTGIEWLGTG